MLQARLLGRVAAKREGEQVPLSPSAGRLLDLPALRPGPHDREAAAALKWPGTAGPAARASLRTAVWALRKAAGDDALIASRTTVGLRPEAVTVDAADCGRRAAAGDRAVPRRAAGRIRRGLRRGGAAAAAKGAGGDAGLPVRRRRA